MTKSEIISRLEIKLNKPKDEIKIIIDAFLNEIVENVKKGDKVNLRGFGLFTMKEQAERSVYSPIAGKNVKVPSKNILVFKASKTLDVS